VKYIIKDIGDAAEVNSGDENPWKELITLSFWSTVLIVSVYFLIAWSSETIITGISVEQEKNWFGGVSMIQGEVLEEGETGESFQHATKLLQRLVLHPEVAKLDYKLIVIESDDLNAFAFPGGTIGVTTKLLDEFKDESALAFVLGHELGHFKHRHHLKGFSKALGLGIAFSIIFGNDSDLILTQNILSLLEANHSQEQESESDEFGVSLVLATLDDVDSIDRFFRLIENEDNSSYRLFSTHPSSESRIKHLKAIVNEITSNKKSS
jgi:Zn-dependent protease with chaperone function